MQRGLPRESFTCPNIFQQEYDRIFSRDWLCAGHLGHVEKPGQFISATLEATQLLIVHGDDGQIRAFHNICRHRGALLCDASSGTLANGCLVCPYHAWAYSERGELLRAPNLREADDHTRSELGLVPIACRVWNGLIMISWSKSPDEFEQDYQAVLTKFEPWGMDQLRVAKTLEYDVQANWKLLFHNYSECYHCPTVHPTLNRLTPYKSAANDLLAGAFLGGPMQLVDGVQSMTMQGEAVSAPLPGLSASQRRQVGYYTVFPNLFISVHPDYVMVHRLQRLSPGRTLIACDFLMPPTVVDDANASTAVEFWDLTNRQDWDVCQRVQAGANSRGYLPGVYTQLETVLPEFDQFYLQRMQ